MEQELGIILHKRKQVDSNNQKKQLKEFNVVTSGEWEQGIRKGETRDCWGFFSIICIIYLFF